MSKKQSARKPGPRSNRTFPPAEKSRPTATTARPQRRWGLIVLFLTITIGGTYLAIFLRPKPVTPRFRYEVLATYDHDPLAFTQGIVTQGDVLWESTGRYGESSLRKIELGTGKILQQSPLEDSYFGEGLTLFQDRLYQLTWKSGKAFVYDLDMNLVQQLTYEGEGWGLAHDGKNLILSDGSRELKFLDPKDLSVIRTIWVRQPSGANVGQLNELEFYDGKIYANRYQSDLVYEIEPENGRVTKVIDLGGLWPSSQRPDGGILNGIAVNSSSGKMIVTGKLCPKLFEINLIPADR